ncbi:MAG: hypothetical protein HY363_04760 [Candidatus Aenigmarchaeota archaeon]|nr:hypothetical protein [Candidatus Aenigmarchaeota archaeon]
MLETIVCEAGIRRTFVVKSVPYFPAFRHAACLLSNLIIEAIMTYALEDKKQKVQLRHEQWQKNYETLLRREYYLLHKIPEKILRSIKDELKPHYAYSDDDFLKPTPSNKLWTILQSAYHSEKICREDHTHCRRIADILKRIIIKKKLSDKYGLLIPIKQYTGYNTGYKQSVA